MTKNRHGRRRGQNEAKRENKKESEDAEDEEISNTGRTVLWVAGATDSQAAMPLVGHCKSGG